ncbi:hypothetical protein GCM10022255_079350 [Dactylosporangium darangshiense]|uniref:DivIVA domain-containing protein n=1 Tax=Dactylosporangium darangshiense TaxID=579108 RepID=A0ABP8DKT5_9ACTN
MELQRRRRSLGLAVLVVVFGLVALVCAWGAVNTATRIVYAACGVLALLIGTVLMRDELRPFRFVINADGLTLRDGTTLAWSQVDRIILDEPTPPATSGPHLILQPGDRIVLKLDEVKQPQAQIAEALQRYAGDRFDNRMARRGDRAEFLVVLRGYEPGRVDNLLRRAGDALLSGDPAQRAEAREALENPDLLVAMRGYDRAQVDAHLRKLAARLTD